MTQKEKNEDKNVEVVIYYITGNEEGKMNKFENPLYNYFNDSSSIFLIEGQRQDSKITIDSARLQYEQ